MLITIANFSKYNPRGDVKHPTWFRLENDFCLDEDLFGATALTKLCWVYLLGLRNKHGDGPFKVNEEKAAIMLPCSVDDFCNSVKWLESKNLLAVSDRARTDLAVSDRVRSDPILARAGGRTGGTDGRTVEEGADATPLLPKTESMTPSRLMEIWNQETAAAALPKCMSLSKGRQKYAGARIAEHPDPEFWRGVIKRIAASSFCRGNNDRNWKADIDFLLKPDSWARVLEGKYDKNFANGSDRGKPVVHRLPMLQEIT